MLSPKLTYLKWSFLALSLGSVIYAGFLMLTAKHSMDQIIDAVAIQAGTMVANPDMTEYDGDRLVWRLQADSAQEKDSVLLLVNPVIDMFTTKGENMPIQAKHGVYDKKNQVIHFEGDVLVGYRDWDLSSKKLDFFEAKDEVIVPESFVLEQEGITITGKDMRIYHTIGRLHILKGVHMSIEESQ